MDKKEFKTTNRTRNWATIVYPESAPEDWRERLAELKVPSYISPLHDRDINANGEIKKAHYHVIIMFASVKAQTQVKSVIADFGGVGTEYVQSLRGYARYLCHLDNPEKAQYDTADILSLCGAQSISELISSESDKKALIKQMLDFCRENDIYEFSDLAFYSMDNRQDWYEVLAGSNPMVFVKEVLRSMAFVRGKRGIQDVQR